MEILLVAAHIHEMLYSKITYKKNIINRHAVSTSLLVDTLSKELKMDAIVILDEGIDEAIETLEKKIVGIKTTKNEINIIFITRNLELKERLKNCTIYFEEKIRVSFGEYDERLMKIIKVKEKKLKEIAPQNVLSVEAAQEEIPINKERMSLFSKFKRSKNNEVEQQEDNRFKHISKGISRVIVVTGHRGVGVTSTAVNLAHEAAKRNLSTIIIDLDILNRTTNLYFSEFIRQAEEDEHLEASLIKCLAKPQEYQNYACNIRDKLWMTGLSYNFHDKKLIEQFFEPNKLINMLTVFRQYFNMVIIDCPLEILGEFHACIPNIDLFGLCVHNSQYSIITTLRNMDTHLSESNISFLNAKSKLIITSYNDRAQYEDDFFTPDKVSELFASDLCEELTIKMQIAGAIRYSEGFDLQVENDIPITENNPEFKDYYSNILLRMLEGVH